MKAMKAPDNIECFTVACAAVLGGVGATTGKSAIEHAVGAVFKAVAAYAQTKGWMI